MAINEITRADMFSFSRQGKAYAIRQGEIVEYQENVLREIYEDDKRVGVILEKPSFNIIPDSARPRNISVKIAFAGTYTLSIHGDGGAEVDLGSGYVAFTDKSFTFTISVPTTINILVFGFLAGFQLEAGPTATSFIKTPETEGAGREVEVLSHGRDTFFSRNSGTFIGEFYIDGSEEDASYLTIVGKDGREFSLIGGSDETTFSFGDGSSSIEFINPMEESGVVKFAIVYHAREQYIRCYLNEEVGELSLPDYFVPDEILFASGDVIPSRVLLDRYEYRPKALGNTEISRRFDYEFELAYDFEVTPEQVSDWADRIFASSLYGFSA